MTFRTALTLTLLTVPLLAAAQIAMPSMAELELDPPSPAPEGSFTATLQSFSTDLTRAAITWSVDGKVIQSGTGVRAVTLTAPVAGKSMRITVTARTREGETVTRSATLAPAYVDLHWEADTHTPPAYRGRALPSGGATFRVTALPDVRDARGVRVRPESLVYTWTVNAKKRASESGVGKQTLVITGSLFETSADVRVSVATLDGARGGEARVEIPFISPEIHFYDEHPLAGTRYGIALDAGGVLTAREGSVRAEPYYLARSAYVSPRTRAAWNIDGALTSPRTPYLLTIVNEAKRAGEVRVGLALQHPDELLQSAAGSFVLVLKP